MNESTKKLIQERLDRIDQLLKYQHSQIVDYATATSRMNLEIDKLNAEQVDLQMSLAAAAGQEP